MSANCVSVCSLTGEDYIVLSTDVLLLEGESSKYIPIFVLDDLLPEIEETFLVVLSNKTTGDAVLGELTQATVTILPSDDPFGAFGMYS